jgi:hypothetical membrane protein
MQFVILTLLAATLYPGGFDFIRYHFSELGAAMARNGEHNTLSATLFSVTLTTIALTLIPFWLITPSLFSQSKLEKALSKLGSILGLLSSPFMIGVALTPMDVQLTQHYTMWLLFFPLFTTASLLYSIASLIQRKHLRHIGVFGLTLFVMVLIVMTNPLAPTTAVLQKVLLYGYFMWIMITTHLFWSTRTI